MDSRKYEKHKKYIYKYNNSYIIKRYEILVAQSTDISKINKIYKQCEKYEWNKEKLHELRNKYVTPHKEKRKRKKNTRKQRYISKNIYGMYYITYKNKYYCGSYDLDTLLPIRDSLEENNWDELVIPDELRPKRRIRRNLPRYIQPCNKGYRIFKDGKHWGVFPTLESAVEERDLLVKFDWTLEYIDLV